MTKKDLVKVIAGKTGYTQKDVTAVVDTVFETITDSMIAGDAVKITGFGTFATTTRAARTGRNPQTGEAIKIPAITSPKFSASATLKKTIKENTI